MKALIRKLYRNESIHHFTIYGFGQFFNLVTPLLVVPYIIGVCGEENFGKTAVGMSLAFFLIVFVDYGSDIIGLRRVSVARGNVSELRTIFYNGYGVKAVMLLAMLTLASLAIYTIPFFNDEKLLFLLSLSVLIGQFINPTWFLQGLENVRWITTLNILSKIIYLIGVFTTVTAFEDYIYVNLWWGIGMIVANLWTLVRIINRYQLGPIRFNWSTIQTQIRGDFAMFSSQIFVSLQLYAPILLISYLGGHAMAGQYRIVEQVIVVFKTYIFLFFNYIFARVCFQLDQVYQAGMRTWKLFNGLNFLFIGGCMLFINWMAKPIVAYFNPNNVEVLKDLLHIATVYPVLLAISIPLKQLVLAWNHNRFYVRVTITTVLLNLIAIAIFLPRFELHGVFYSLIITELLVILFYLSCIRKNLRA